MQVSPEPLQLTGSFKSVAYDLWGETPEGQPEKRHPVLAGQPEKKYHMWPGTFFASDSSNIHHFSVRVK